MSDFFDELFKTEIPAFIVRCPVAFEWWHYNGEMIFAGINYERSLKAKKPMIDIYYCATEALNDNVIKTVQFDKNKFRKAQ